MVSTAATWAIVVGIPATGYALFRLGAWQQRRADRAANEPRLVHTSGPPPFGFRILTDRDHFYDWPNP